MLEIKARDKLILIDDTTDIRFSRHWKNVQTGKWEPNTFRIFDRFLNKDHSYIDLGAWIGSTILYGAHITRHVYAAEPDPIALNYLRKNINLNPSLKKKITLYEGAISTNNGIINLTTKKGIKFGSSGASIVDKQKEIGKSVEVTTLSFDCFITFYNITDCNFIKMDIEGAETTLLPTMKEYFKENKPVLYLSLHPKNFTQDNSESMLDTLSVYNKFYDGDNFKIISFSKLLKFKSIIATM